MLLERKATMADPTPVLVPMDLATSRRVLDDPAYMLKVQVIRGKLDTDLNLQALLAKSASLPTELADAEGALGKAQMTLADLKRELKERELEVSTTLIATLVDDPKGKAKDGEAPKKVSAAGTNEAERKANIAKACMDDEQCKALASAIDHQEIAIAEQERLTRRLELDFRLHAAHIDLASKRAAVFAALL